jgi:RimJ/RimL family protein N-acetyltransferase
MLYGKRIRLRAIEKEDLLIFVPWLNDPEVRRNLQFFQPLSLAQEEEWFKGTLQQPVEEQPLVRLKPLKAGSRLAMLDYLRLVILTALLKLE